MARQSAQLAVQKQPTSVVRKTAVPVLQKVLEGVLARNAAAPVARPGAGLVGWEQTLGEAHTLLVPGGQARTTSSRRDVLVLRKLSAFGARNLAHLLAGKPAPGKTRRDVLVLQKLSAFGARNLADLVAGKPAPGKTRRDVLVLRKLSAFGARNLAGLVGQEQALGEAHNLLVPGGHAQTTGFRRDALVLRKLSALGARDLADLVAGKPAPGKPAPGKTSALQVPKSTMQPGGLRKAFLLDQKPAALVRILGFPVVQKPAVLVRNPEFPVVQNPAVLVRIPGFPVVQKLTYSSPIPDTSPMGIPTASDRSAGNCCRTSRWRRSRLSSPGWGGHTRRT